MPKFLQVSVGSSKRQSHSTKCLDKYLEKSYNSNLITLLKALEQKGGITHKENAQKWIGTEINKWKYQHQSVTSKWKTVVSLRKSNKIAKPLAKLNKA